MAKHDIAATAIAQAKAERRTPNLLTAAFGVVALVGGLAVVGLFVSTAMRRSAAQGGSPSVGPENHGLVNVELNPTYSL